MREPKKEKKMKLEEVKDILQAELLCGDYQQCTEIDMVSGSDLLSDVLAFTKAGSLLLTGLANPQVIRTAEMVDICAICFVRGKKPEKETIELAEAKGIPLLCTDLPMYEACGRLYENGLPGCFEFQKGR